MTLSGKVCRRRWRDTLAPQRGAKKEEARWEPGFRSVWLAGPKDQNLRKGPNYGRRIADFPLLKIRSGTYFLLTNTVI